MNRQKQSTLIDVIGVLAISAFLIAILFPAVQVVRARTACRTSPSDPVRVSPVMTSLSKIDSAGNQRITSEEWQALFRTLSRNRGYLTPEDLRLLLPACETRSSGTMDVRDDGTPRAD